MLLSTQTVVGFYIHWTFYLSGGVACVVGLIASASFFLGMCFYIMEMVADIRQQLSKIDNILQLQTSHLSKHVKLSMIINREIRFHSNIIEYDCKFLVDSVEIPDFQTTNNFVLIIIFYDDSFYRLAQMAQASMSALIFYQLLMCATVVAFNMFNFMVNGVSVNFEFIVSFYELLCSVIPTFIYCFLSSEVTFSLLVIGDIYFECPWYHLHLNQQKLFILMIARSQRNFCFGGFGIVHCSLDTFLSVRLIFEAYLKEFFTQKNYFSHYHIRLRSINFLDNPNIRFIFSSYAGHLNKPTI